jgi:hypothetical protein
MVRSSALAALVLFVSVQAVRADDPPGRKRRTPPQEFGRVVLANQARKVPAAGRCRS